MNNSLRIITFIGVHIPLIVIWNLSIANIKEKILFSGIQLSIGLGSLIILEIIFNSKRKRRTHK